MKRLVILMIVGVMLGVTACGSKPSTEATDASSVETAGNSTTEESFDADGNATYSYTTDKDGEKNVDDDSELTRLFEEYEKAEVIEFGVEKP